MLPTDGSADEPPRSDPPEVAGAPPPRGTAAGREHAPNRGAPEADGPNTSERLPGLDPLFYVGLAITLASFGAAAYAIVQHESIWADLQGAAADGAAVACLWQLGELQRWRRKGYLADLGLRHRLRGFPAARFVVLVAIAVAGNLLEATPAGAIIAAVALGVLARCSVVFEEQLRPKLARLAAQGDQGTARLRVRVSTDAVEVVFRIPRWLVREATAARHSRAVHRLRPHASIPAILTMTAVFLAIGIASAALFHHSKRKGGASATETSSTTTAKPPQPTTTVTTPTPPATQTEVRGECPAPLAQNEATPQAAAAMSRLFNEETPLGPAEEGCLGHIHRHHFRGETYFTAIGTYPNTKTRLSLALDSERYGTILIRQAAAADIEALDAKLGPVGGVSHFPLYGAGAGEFYVLRSRVGYYALTRARSSESFVVLTPTEARAWLGTMKDRGEWLWPAPPIRVSPGETRIGLRSTTEPETTTATITLDPATGTADRGAYSYHTKPVRQLSLSELISLSRTA